MHDVQSFFVFRSFNKSTTFLSFALFNICDYVRINNVFQNFQRIDCKNKNLFFICLISEKFREAMVSFEEFCKNPSILNDPKLVIKMNNK